MKTAIFQWFFNVATSTVIGLSVGYFYYGKSLANMTANAEEGRRVNELILRGIEGSGGNVQFHRDQLGRVTGLKVNLSGAAAANASGSGVLSNK